MMRSLRHVVAVGLMLAVPALPAQAQDAPGAAIVRAGARALPEFLRPIQETHLPQFGFPSRDAADAAELGVAFQVHTVDPRRLIAAEASVGLTDLAVATPQWQLVVMSHGRARAVMTVAPLDGRWRGVAIGASGLAAQLHDLVERWPAARGYRCRLIRVYQAASDAVEVRQDGRLQGVVPLASSRAALGLTPAFDPQDLRDTRDMAAALRPLVAAGLGSGRPR